MSNMEQSSKNAATRDAPTKLEEEESALGMEQSKLKKPVAMKDAGTTSRTEESAGCMEQRSKHLVMTDVLTKLETEAYAGGMGQNRKASPKD